MQEQGGETPTVKLVSEYADDIRARNPNLDSNDPVVRRLAFLYRVIAQAEADYEGDAPDAKVIIDYQKLSNDALRLERALGLLAGSRTARPSGVPSARRGPSEFA